MDRCFKWLSAIGGVCSGQLQCSDGTAIVADSLKSNCVSHCRNLVECVRGGNCELCLKNKSIRCSRNSVASGISVCISRELLEKLQCSNGFHVVKTGLVETKVNSGSGIGC